MRAQNSHDGYNPCFKQASPRANPAPGARSEDLRT